MKNPFDQFDMPATLPAGQNPFDQFDTSAQQPSLLDQAGHQLGLTGRYLAEGAMTPFLMVGDALNAGVNSGIGGINKLANTNIPQLAPASSTFFQALTDAGVPEPQNGLERVVGDMSRAVVGAGTGIGMGNALRLASDLPVAQKIGSALSASPGLQATSATTASGAGGIARENGASPTAQIAASLLAGIGGPAAAETTYQAAKGIGRTIPALIQPFTEGGRQQIVGNTLMRLANDPEQALNNLSNYQEFVPGSMPTTGEASKDFGLIAAERGMRNTNAADFAQRYSQNNAARNILLNNIAGDENTLQAAENTRDTVTSDLRNAAFGNSKPVDIAPVQQKIADILQAPEGKRTAVAGALSDVNDMLQGETDPARLYAVRQDIGQMMSGKLQNPNRSDYSLAKSQLIQVRNALDDTIEQGAPGFKNYLSQYKEMSQPINQMESGQDIIQRTRLAAPDPSTDQPIISQAKWTNVVAKNRNDLSKVLTSDQMDKLDAITADLDRGAATNTAPVRPSGSDTTQNLTTANIIGRLLGGNTTASSPLMQTVARPLSWIYQIPDHAVHSMLVDAMLDPTMARGLLAKATPENTTPFAEELKRRAFTYPIGGAIGAAQTQQQQ